jgi:acetoin:2,6-dichlorophenolindophenol oxidoreductase subunit beta
MSRTISFTQAINEALHQAMARDKNVVCYGLGVGDPK